MKTVKTSSEQVSPEKSTKHNPKLVQNFTSSKTDRQTSKIRNFGWLVTGMMEACHQINIDDLSEVD